MIKKNLLRLFLGSGWLLLSLFLISGYYFNSLSNDPNTSKFSPITWNNHMQIFKGAIQCQLIDEKLLQRKTVLKDSIFSQVIRKEVSMEQHTYYFDHDSELLDLILEHIKIERQCCPFFQFDISIPAYESGFALKISGSTKAIELLREFEEERI